MKRTASPPRDSNAIRRALKLVDETVSLPREHYNAVRRVLKLVDGYLCEQPQHTLVAYGGGMMTWAELREHTQAAIKLLPPARRP